MRNTNVTTADNAGDISMRNMYFYFIWSLLETKTHTPPHTHTHIKPNTTTATLLVDDTCAAYKWAIEKLS